MFLFVPIVQEEARLRELEERSLQAQMDELNNTPEARLAEKIRSVVPGKQALLVEIYLFIIPIQ